MQIVKFPLGQDVECDLSVSNGKLIIKVEIEAKEEVDKLLDYAKSKAPDLVKPLLDGAKAAIDAQLAAA